MRVRDDSLLSVALALRKADTALPAIEALRGNSDPVAVEGLFELIVATPASRPVVAALNALGEVEHPLVVEALRAGMQSKYAPARLAAVQLAARREHDELAPTCIRVMLSDDSWPNRRAALEMLAARPSAVRWSILRASDDPHWRVRHALIRELRTWGDSANDRAAVLLHLRNFPDTARTRGVARYLEWAWSGVAPSFPDEPNPVARCHFWDWDPAVLAAKLARMGKRGRAEAIDVMPFLVGHEEERVWKPAVETIRDEGEPRHFAEAVAWLDDPRNGAGPAIERLFAGLDGDRTEDVARYVVESPSPTIGQLLWVQSQLGDAIPLDPSEPWQQQFANVRPPDPIPEAANPVGPFARAAQLSADRAADLLADPHRETSWLVLDAACRLMKRPIWDIEPERPWQPSPTDPVPASPIAVTLGTAPHRTLLGRERLEVSHVGVSGHYLLPVAGFVKAAEAGVNWFFWEPNYATLTDFAGRLSPDGRRQFHFVAGTFEAEGKRIRTDVERALRMLRVERLGLFLVFWVQSWDRLTDDVRETVRRLKEEGKAACVGLSSHNRPLLVQAMEEGWNPVMARHSAAHRGAEPHVFPKAAELGTTLLTFNNLCYGRMLQPIAGLEPPDPADCYRYSLSFPGVSACWSAPSTGEQLDANLRTLRDPELPAARREYLERFGAALYQEETVFRRLVRTL